MKRYFITVILLLTLLTTPASARQDNTPQISEKNPRKEQVMQMVEEKKATMEAKRQEIMQRVEEKKASRAAVLQDKNRERIRSYYSRLSTRIRAMIDRLNTLLERIQTRIDNLEEENGVDIETIEADLEEAQLLLDDSLAQIEVLDENLEDVLDSDNPRYEFGVFIKEGVKSIKQNLIEAHLLMVKVIGDIKGLRIGNYE